MQNTKPTVWIINLKDNSGNGSKKNFSEKFDECYKNNLIAIGWTTKKSICDDESNFNKAYTCLSNMKTGDLVWTRNPVTKKYYICEIVGNEVIKMSPPNNNCDIGYTKSVKYGKGIEKCDLPAGITYRNLISRSTARKVNNKNVINISIDYFRNKYNGEN